MASPDCVSGAKTNLTADKTLIARIYADQICRIVWHNHPGCGSSEVVFSRRGSAFTHQLQYNGSRMTGEIFGFKQGAWDLGKLQATCAIVCAGKKDQFITYSELANAVTAIRIEPHDFAMIRLLDEISKEEDTAGRGILTALVVLKDKRVPAEGFWASARDIGRVIRDKWTFWSEEVKRVMGECKNRPMCT